jgi:hypothetical protein
MCAVDPVVLVRVKNHNGNRKFNYNDHKYFKKVNRINDLNKINLVDVFGIRVTIIV